MKVLRPGDSHHSPEDLPVRPVVQQKSVETIPVDWLEQYDRTPVATIKLLCQDPEYARRADLVEERRRNNNGF